MPQVLHRAVIVILGLLMITAIHASVPRMAIAFQDAAPVTQVALEPRTVQAGSVTIKVTSQPSDTSLVFSIVLDTHSVDLDQYDLSLLASLRTDQGGEIQPEVWEAPKGSHHREGSLVFPRFGVDGAELIGPDANGVELVIRQIGGVPETVILWTLAV
jgi:hypothetical protein